MFNLKYQAKTFDEIIGHKPIMTELNKRRKLMGFNNYNLISGPSGVGKTTIAKLIGKLLNCHEPIIDSYGRKNPCNKCESCLDIINNNYPKRDVKMYGGGDLDKGKIKLLIKSLDNTNMYDENRVIIIDEVQLIIAPTAKSEFNKLCDSIKDKVYIILTTTEPDKFDTAFRRRFTEYKLKSLLDQDIAKYLQNLCIKNNFNCPDTFKAIGINTISEIAAGSIGVALKLLEDCMNKELWTKEDIEDYWETYSPAKVFNILTKIIRYDTSGLVDLILMDNFEEFFNLTYTILMGIAIYKKTNFVKISWQAKQYKSLMDVKQADILELIGAFNRTKQLLYAGNVKNFFIGEILKYYGG